MSEFLCILGTFQASDKWATGVWAARGPRFPARPRATLAPGTPLSPRSSGVIVAAMYLLIMVGKVVFGPLKEPAGHGGLHGHDEHHGHEDAHATEAHLPADLTRARSRASCRSPLRALSLVSSPPLLSVSRARSTRPWP